MPQATRKRDSLPALTLHLGRGLREGALWLFGALAVYLLIALLTYDPGDPGWSHSADGETVRNAGGTAGAYFADAVLYLFGYMAFVFPLMLAFAGWMLFRGLPEGEPTGGKVAAIRGAGFVLTLAGGSALASLHFPHPTLQMPLSAGGMLGDFVGGLALQGLGAAGGTLILLAVFVAGVTAFTGLSWLALMDHIGAMVIGVYDWAIETAANYRDSRAGVKARAAREEAVGAERKKRESRPAPRIEPVIKAVAVSDRAERERQVPLFKAAEGGSELPPLSLLNEPEPAGKGYSEATLEAMSRQLEHKLQDFGVEGQIVAVHPGPVITRFELQPGPGVKVSQITALAKDLARALSVTSVRVVEVIPGKPTVGLEIPNEHRELVCLSELLQSKAYDDSHSPITLVLGKDIGGAPVVADLGKMPHLLVAGTTGSGKSVAINAMLLSLLYKAPPSEVRLILVDPKMLELSVYEGIPHLLAPVVTDMKEAASALRWCTVEMDRRYKLMASLGVRNLGGYNRKIEEAAKAGKPIPDPLFEADPTQPADVPPLDELPHIVVIIDELADMMMVVGKKVEELIARLAQKARASGIHLILATQRPSVDVITGLIKANIPTRIAFQVSSKVDSRTIIDQMGAEALLGNGDMLYLPPGTGLPQRVHGAYVGDQEVHRVVEHLRGQGSPVYLEDVLREASEDGNGGLPGEIGAGGGESDPLYDQAVQIVIETRRASISAVQRRLKIGYNRAARMVEEMERAGLVGPLQPNGSREVLVPSQD